MKPLVLDAETYFDQEYSLRKIPTGVFIKDSRFELFGFSFMDFEDGSSGWVDETDLTHFLSQHRYSERMAVSHNAQFDHGIIAHLYGKLPMVSACTMQMSYAVLGNCVKDHSLDTVAQHLGLGFKKKGVLPALKGKHTYELTADEWVALEEYAQQDSLLCGMIFAVLSRKMNADTMKDMDWAIRQFLDPVLMLDEQTLMQELEDVLSERQQQMDRFGTDLKQLRSDTAFADMLRVRGVEPPMVTRMLLDRKSGQRVPVTKPTFSRQSREFMTIAEDHPDTSIRDLCQLRLMAKSTSTTGKLERMLELGKAFDWWFPIPINFAGAVQTKRPSGRDKVNVLNMGRGSKTREAVIVPPGKVMVVGDLSGAELRACRWVCNDVSAMNVLHDPDGDLYVDFYADLADKGPDEVTKDERFVGKVCQLSLQYATGAAKLRHTVWTWGRVDVSDEQAARITRFFRRVKHRAVPAYWRYIEKEVLPLLSSGKQSDYTMRNAPFLRVSDGKIHLPSGLCIEYPKLRKQLNPETDRVEWMYQKGRMQSNVYGGSVLENISQALVNVMINDKIREMERMGYRAAFTVYDEIMIVCDESEADQAEADLEKVLSKSPDWWPDIPLTAECAVGTNYAEAK